MRTKITFLSLIFFAALTANATIHEVHVADFHFDPVKFDAVVGDSVKFIWDNGEHTTTSAAIPGAAEAWDEPINSSNKTFIYVIKVAGDYTYFCKKHGDQVASFTASGTLAVQLINFQITNTANNKALISWNTVSEQNASYFSIQKSVDAKNFTEAGKVKAAGNSSALHHYSFTDNTVNNQSKLLYYRIAVIDNDAAIHYSDIKIFRNSITAKQLIVALSPNPAGSTTHIHVQFNADAKGKMLVQVFSTSGKLLKQTMLECTAGVNSSFINLNNIPAGIYNIKFSQNDISETKTLILQ
jgi:plastocyanin